MVQSVATFTAKIKDKLPQKQSVIYHKFKGQNTAKTQDMLRDKKRIAIFAQIKIKF